jgi:hypothetical protein
LFLGWKFWNFFSSVADAKCYVVVDAHATMRRYIDTMMRRHDKQDVKTRRYDNATTLLSMPMCTYIIIQFTNLFEL